MKAIKTILLGGLAATALTACDRVGSPMEVLTGKRSAPDEFRVVTRKPLNMPGSATLPEPRLGERSPLEHDPSGDAREVLTGKRDVNAGGGSAGESALVAAATSNTKTGTAGASLAEREVKVDRTKPYEPPSVLELVSGKSKKAAKDVLDPDVEARRLRAGGKAKTPVNPKDAAAAGEEKSGEGYVSPGEKYEPKFPYGVQKKGS